MKIICENKEEYISLMKTFRYLHDHGMFNRKCNGLDTDFEMVNPLIHMYLGKDDFENKDSFIEIKTGENIHEIDRELRQKINS